MRGIAASVLVVSIALATAGAGLILHQKLKPAPVPTPAAPVAGLPGGPPDEITPPVPVPVVATTECADNPRALGVSRIVEVDTTGGPGFGFEHFKQHDFLRDKEVVLTFDDGPWPHNTPAVLAALAAHCLKATFFPIGKHAAWHPEILRQVAEAGHTIGSHTWSHATLSRKSRQDAIREIEMGASAVRLAAGAPTAPFFRFPALRHAPDMLAYLGQRNIAIFSCDMDSFDFTMRKPEQVVRSVMTKLEKHGKGIVLLHDFQRATSQALPELLHQLEANGYRIVHMVPKAPLQTIAQFDEMLSRNNQLAVVSAGHGSTVVRTIREAPH